MPGQEQLWVDTQGQGTEAGKNGVQTPRGGWATTQSKSAERLAAPQVFITYRQLCIFTHRDAEPISCSNICKIDQRCLYAGRDVRCTPLLFSQKHRHSAWSPWFHDTQEHHPGSSSPTMQTAGPKPVPLPSAECGRHTSHHAQKGRNGERGLRLLLKAQCVPTGPCKAHIPHEV